MRSNVVAWILGGALVLLLAMFIVGWLMLFAAVAGLREEVAAIPPPHIPTGGAEVAFEDPGPPKKAEPLWGWPLHPDDYLMLTSPFGVRTSPILGIEAHHLGVDIAGTWRAQVITVDHGVVIEHWPPPDGYYRGHETHGGYLVIRHDNGMITSYSHLSSTRVNTGDRVVRGQVIGRVGNTGRSDGEHLHFEVHTPEGQHLNPLLYIGKE